MRSGSGRAGVLPGFGISMGYTLLYLGLLVLIPLVALLFKSAGLGWSDFWKIATAPRVMASYRITFGASLLAAAINLVFGAIVAWVLVSLGFRLYLHYFNFYSVTYGSLGAVIILLMWFYITGFMLLLGAEINSEIEAAAAERSLSGLTTEASSTAAASSGPVMDRSGDPSETPTASGEGPPDRRG